jgi:hypothetical protein
LKVPFEVKTNELISARTPAAFKAVVTNSEIKLLPMVSDRAKNWRAGWVTYSDGFENNPDVEVVCGGENEKAATAAAVWRQGNLLHFGFEQDPADLNENGRRLLLNSIAYISKFTEDRPIAVTPSVFAGKVGLPRTYLDRRISNGFSREDLEWIIAPDLLSRLEAMAIPEMQKWFTNNRGYLHPSDTADKKLEIDAQAKDLGIAFDNISFFEKCVAKLSGAQSSAANDLLQRYAPTETANLKTSAEWSRWLKENRDYLFFSDQGDYRWYIDPLAKARKTPSAKLRGPARASK